MQLRLAHLKQQYDKALTDGDIKNALHIKLQIEDIEGEQSIKKRNERG